MKRFFVGLLALIGGLTVVFIAATIALVITAARRTPSISSEVVLEWEIDEPLVEAHPEESLAGLFGRSKPTVRDVVEALERAAKDGRVKGLVAHISESPGSMAAVQELRDAVRAFRKSGKKAIAYADTYGEMGPGNGAYYFASAFDEVYVQPSGEVGLTGFAAETPFAKDALAKLGVKPQFGQRYEYKNAPNSFTEQGYTAAHREATEKYVGSLFSQLLSGVAQDRKLKEEEVRGWVDHSPLSGEQALAAKLVDGLLYRDEVYAKVREWSDDADLLYVGPYLKRSAPREHAGPRIALIYGVGAVVRGKGDSHPLSDEGNMASESVSAAFRAAVDDDEVKAIVFRVDSPGGSYIASDTIRREVQRARARGKPVVVSMAGLAASGGYFVAMEADRIVAQPGTLTGSIGVYGGKMVTAGLWEKLGVNWETIAFGKNANMMSSDQDFTPEQRALFDASLDRIYQDFTAKAAAGRKLPVERLREVAKGRVWTGEDAKGLGLVDVLGGYPAALALAQELAKLPKDATPQIQVFPRPKKAAEWLAELLGEEAEENSEEEGTHARSFMTSFSAQVRSLARKVSQVQMLEQGGVLSAPVSVPRQ